MDFSPSRYDHAIELFLSEYPNGEIRKRPRHLDGHNYPKKRKSRPGQNKNGPNVNLLHETISSSSSSEDEEENVNIADIDINEISDDNWSDSDDEI